MRIEKRFSRWAAEQKSLRNPALNSNHSKCKTSIFPLEIGIKNPNFCKYKGSRLDPITWFNFCNESLFSGMTLTTQQPDSLFWCHAVCSSFMSAPLPAKGSCRTCELIVLLLSFNADNNMATNLQRFASSYGSKSFATCDCPTQTFMASNAARQSLLLAVSHVVLYCVERSISESVVILPQV